jgi:hypothetical protein
VNRLAFWLGMVALIELIIGLGELWFVHLALNALT